jgi:hypothetical protein
MPNPNCPTYSVIAQLGPELANSFDGGEAQTALDGNAQVFPFLDAKNVEERSLPESAPEFRSSIPFQDPSNMPYMIPQSTGLRSLSRPLPISITRSPDRIPPKLGPPSRVVLSPKTPFQCPSPGDEMHKNSDRRLAETCGSSMERPTPRPGPAKREGNKRH